MFLKFSVKSIQIIKILHDVLKFKNSKLRLKTKSKSRTLFEIIVKQKILGRCLKSSRKRMEITEILSYDFDKNLKVRENFSFSTLCMNWNLERRLKFTKLIRNGF